MKQHLLTQLSTFHSQLSTLNSPFSIILFPLFLAGIASAHADDTWQHIIYEHGFDLAFVANLSESSNIKLAEPRCAFVNITGIDKMPNKKDQDLHAWLECYDGNGKYFKKRVIMNAQGNSSLAYPKKNLSVSFCEDEWEGHKTTDITFGKWIKQDTFHLKAYYTDTFRGVGKIAYDIYDDIVSDREQPLPWQRAGVATASEKATCHPNGFPCYVYLNNKFYGLYVWSLKKSHKNMGQEKDNALHIHLDGKLDDTTIFNRKIDWSQFDVRTPKKLYCTDTEVRPLEDNMLQYRTYDGDFPSELIDETMPYYDPDNPDHLITSQVKHSLLNLSNYNAELKKLVSAKADTETFKRKFSEMFDTEGMTDYIIHSLVTNNYDGHRKNWQWFTYNGMKWFVEPYDLDCTFGHHASGAVILPPEWIHHYRSFYQSFGYTSTEKFFIEYFFDDIKDRYHALREKGLIDAKRYTSYINEWVERIGSEGYDMEQDKWKDSPGFVETVASPNWETEDDWEGYLTYPVYSADTTYHAGDRCTLKYRIWTATATTKGIRPYQTIGQTDNLQRVGEWIRDRIALTDEYFKFDPDAIAPFPLGEGREEAFGALEKVRARKVVRAGHFYIIKGSKVFSADGRQIQGEKHAFKIY